MNVQLIKDEDRRLHLRDELKMIVERLRADDDEAALPGRRAVLDVLVPCHI